jgi:hypothetical protein
MIETLRRVIGGGSDDEIDSDRHWRSNISI